MRKSLILAFILLSGCSVGSTELDSSIKSCESHGGEFSLKHDNDGRILITYCRINGYRYTFVYQGNGRGYYTDPRVL